MKTLLFVLFALFATLVSAEEELRHGPLPWTLTVAVPADYVELTIPFSKPFELAPVCTPQITNRQTPPVEVIAVSRRMVTVKGDLKKDDTLFISCHMNVTRRSPDREAIYSH